MCAHLFYRLYKMYIIYTYILHRISTQTFVFCTHIMYTHISYIMANCYAYNIGSISYSLLCCFSLCVFILLVHRLTSDGLVQSPSSKLFETLEQKLCKVRLDSTSTSELCQVIDSSRMCSTMYIWSSAQNACV